MSSPDQDSNELADKDGQVPAEDSQVQAEENAAPYVEDHDHHFQHDNDFSPLMLSGVESGLKEISSSEDEDEDLITQNNFTTQVEAKDTFEQFLNDDLIPGFPLIR